MHVTGHLRLWRLLNQDLADWCEGNLGKFDSEPVVGFQMEKARRKFVFFPLALRQKFLRTKELSGPSFQVPVIFCLPASLLSW